MAKRKQKGRHGEGGVRQHGRKWELRFTVNGERITEYHAAQDEREAREILRNLQAKYESGLTTATAEKTVIGDLWPLIKQDYIVHGYHVPTLKNRWKHLRPVFANHLAKALDYAAINTYVVNRFQQDKAAPSSVRNEIACLRRMMKLGKMNKRVTTLPEYPTITVKNEREVFWEPDEFNTIYDDLPDYCAIIILTILWTGFRAKEFLPLQWPDLNLETGETRLKGEWIKNKENKTVFLPQPLLEEIRLWRRTTEALMQESHTIIPWVFHRRGKPIKSYRTVWDNARKRHGLEGKHLHDLIRTFARILNDADVDPKTSMKVMGKKTQAIFERYNIRDKRDLLLASQKISTQAKKWAKKPKANPDAMGQ